MTIDDAIELLQTAKKDGVKSVIAAWWYADQFGRKDDDKWADDAEFIDRKMDWSSTHDDLRARLDTLAAED